MANRQQVEDALGDAVAGGANAEELRARFLAVTNQGDLSGEDEEVLARFVAKIPRTPAKKAEEDKPAAPRVGKASQPTKKSTGKKA